MFNMSVMVASKKIGIFLGIFPKPEDPLLSSVHLGIQMSPKKSGFHAQKNSHQYFT